MSTKQDQKPDSLAMSDGVFQAKVIGDPANVAQLFSEWNKQHGEKVSGRSYEVLHLHYWLTLRGHKPQLNVVQEKWPNPQLWVMAVGAKWVYLAALKAGWTHELIGE